ncbi:hypothetical protein PoB_006286900 [Plakobranchus ocellatus]|uniref:Uncharacterized protein n=1 Tax=Plakobranchus ocellatus TaxID=259542 RepID=A0AAV4CWS6_9GAST|nr:hypothetical protein PoB_006286900 [Plakobranchus ocellatus]
MVSKSGCAKKPFLHGFEFKPALGLREPQSLRSSRRCQATYTKPTKFCSIYFVPVEAIRPPCAPMMVRTGKRTSDSEFLADFKAREQLRHQRLSPKDLEGTIS